MTTRDRVDSSSVHSTEVIDALDHATDVHDSVSQEPAMMFTPIQPNTGGRTGVLSWSKLTFSVPTKISPRHPDGRKVLLNEVTGRCGPGEIMAVMGPSGCGKTTLLDILADRVSSGRREGDLELNGLPRNIKQFRSMACYVAQEDSLLGSFTVLETLHMAAQLSLPSTVTKRMIQEQVQTVIDEMGLRVCEHAFVGTVFRKGISGGQKRRLSIAIELLSNPSILLLDEPTSGLDSSSTYSVMKIIADLCKRKQKTVICTIHQPSSLVYELFTHLMLLTAGRTVYCGPREQAMNHFASLDYGCPPYASPADHFVMLINTDFEGHGDIDKLVTAYADSSISSAIAGQIQKERNPARLVKSFRFFRSLRDLKSQANEETSQQGHRPFCCFSSKRKLKIQPNGRRFIQQDHQPSPWRQFRVLLHRALLNNARNPGIFWVRFAMYVMLATMAGTLFLPSGSRTYTDIDITALIFGALNFLVFLSVSVLPFFIEDRGVFLRERANSSLHVGSYVAANFIAALPGIFLMSLVASAIVVSLAGLNSYGTTLLVLFLSMVAAESLMRVIGALMSNGIVAIAAGSSVYGMCTLCQGFMVPPPAIPSYWKWGYYLAFHSYAFESFMFAQFLPEGHLPQGSAMPLVLVRLGMTHVHVGRNMAVLAGYALVLELIFAAILYFLHTGRR